MAPVDDSGKWPREVSLGVFLVGSAQELRAKASDRSPSPDGRMVPRARPQPCAPSPRHCGSVQLRFPHTTTVLVW